MRGRSDMDAAGWGGYRTARRAIVTTVLGAVVCAFVGVGSAGAAPIIVGSPLTASFVNSGALGDTHTVANTALGETGAHVTSPVTGTIVAWHVIEASGPTFSLSVLTPKGGSEYTQGASTPEETPASTAKQTFHDFLAIKKGQSIALNLEDSNDAIGVTGFVTGSAWSIFTPQLADGTTATPFETSGNEEVGFNAVVQPLPEITGLSRHSGSTRGGKKITIRGKNFDGTVLVYFGRKTQAKSFKVVSDTRIKAVVPRHRAAVVHVFVNNSAWNPASKASKFRFIHS